MGKHTELRLTRNLQMVLAFFIAEPKAEHHGYEIMKATGLLSGRLYPLLYRLVDIGWLERVSSDSDAQTGRRKTTYRLRPDAVSTVSSTLAKAELRFGQPQFRPAPAQLA